MKVFSFNEHLIGNIKIIFALQNNINENNLWQFSMLSKNQVEEKNNTWNNFILNNRNTQFVFYFIIALLLKRIIILPISLNKNLI